MNEWNIIVIGRGITGLSTAYHLARAGIDRVALVGPAPSTSTTQLAAGMIAGGQVDNYTRVSHAHGAEFAKSLWQFGDIAFDALVDFSTKHAVPVQTRRRLRLVVSEAEHREVEKAVNQMNHAGFGTTLSAPRELKGFGGALLERVVAIQDDGRRGGMVDIHRFLTVLGQATLGVIHESLVTGITPNRREKVEVSLSDGAVLRAEIVVVATHLAIGNLVPVLNPALVSVADQWVGMVGGPRDGPWGDAGVVFSANNGYEWGVTVDAQTVHVGGGRYLRKWAGIEATTAKVEPKITSHLKDKLKDTFSWGNSVQVGSLSAAGLDCRPCDELPIIGPLFGEGRVMVATGYMGSGLTHGFFAGKCLADLIARGRCDELPRRLWPERLRTLEV